MMTELQGTAVAPTTYYTYRGAVHIHTSASDGRAETPEIAREAQQAGVDFLIASDHNAYPAGNEGYASGVLVLRGVEISTDSGHALVLGVPDTFRWPSERAQDVATAVHAAGGLFFLAHPEEGPPWTNWDVQNITGLEVANLYALARGLMHTPRLGVVAAALRGIVAGDGTRVLDISSRARQTSVLARWDEQIAARGPVVAIGSVDAHGQMKMGGKYFRIPGYVECFRCLQTHVLTPEPFNGAPAHDGRMVLDALRQGHCYISYALRGDQTGFSFHAEGAGRTAIMGDGLPVGSGVTLTASLPAHQGKALVRLYQDGREVAHTTGDQLTYQATAPGAYRIEAYTSSGRHTWPWLISNPIYLHG